MKRCILLGVVFACMGLSAQAQEICNDGIDNDNNGFIDCYDGSCASNSNCDGTFLGNDVVCQAKPIAFPKFTMQVDFTSPDETINNLSRMALGDLDRDGIPEIITMNRYNKKLYVLDGRNGSIKHQLAAPFTPQWEIAIANIDNDNCGEIFAFGTEGNDEYLYAYNCDLTTQIWRARIPGDPINFGIADFNGDGKAEVYAKDAIFDAKTGTRLIKSNNWNSINGGPVAVDMDDDNKLELVIGCIIYSVNLGNGTADNGSLTEVKRLPEYFIKYAYNATSVADYNLDGSLDVIASGSTESQGKNTTIFFWDVKNNTYDTFFDTASVAYQPNGWKNGTGRINIADLDGNGRLNVSYVSGKFLYALDENLDLFWRQEINEETSGHTGCTLFDFNGDGKSEIVYRDERFLYIINGTDGTIFGSPQPCISRTNREYPIVADVDADGSTEICVPCISNNNINLTNFSSSDTFLEAPSQVRVYKSASEPWVPARRLWNQHGYFVVNVNDDLTIPKIQQKHHRIFSSGSCTVGPNRPLNGFLNQSPYLNSLGCPSYASPDLAHVNGSLTVQRPTCPNKNFTISFQITNRGDVQLDGAVPITFYNGNPSLAGAIKLNTVFASLVGFKPNNVFTVSNATVNGPGGPFTLYIVLNDGGTTVPTPIRLPNTNFVECDYGNNIISTPILPLPVTLTAQKVADNLKCVGATTPNNGAVKAFVPVGATQNTADYNFFWFNGTTVDTTPDFTGPVYTGIAEGTYTVFAVHKTAGCSSDTVDVVVGRVSSSITASINLLSSLTNCQSPNGKLQAIANGGAEPATNFTFAWYQGNDIFTSPQIGVSDVASNLNALTYTVLVTHRISGCQTVQSFTVPNSTTPPTVTATKVDLICSNATSGSASANVNGATAGFTFKWYRGTAVKPTPDFTGTTFANLAQGAYTVVAVANASGCSSAPVTVNLAITTLPVVTATVTSNQTSCNAAQPTGSASAQVGGVTAGFSFEWFKGQNTLAANKIASTPTASNLAVGIYTVKATSAATGCSDTEEVTITLSTTTPTLTSTVVPVTRCNPYNGSITANVSLGTPADYNFAWYNGTVAKATTDFTDTDNVLGNLPPGDYTVVATHKVSQCSSASLVVNVADNSPTITIALDGTITKLPSDCNATDGVMGVDITAVGNTLGFGVEWYLGRAPFADPAIKTENVASTSTASGLSTGVYTVVARDLNSGCSSDEDFDLPFANSHGIELISQNDVTTCVPGDEGSAVVKLIPTALAGFDEDDYDIFLYPGSNDPGPSGTPTETIPGVLTQVDYPTSVPLTAGLYTFVAVSKNPLTIGCRSVPVPMEILQNTQDPEITASSNAPNMNCLGAAGTGQLIASADGASAANYTFEWFNGPTISSPTMAGTGVNGEQLSNLIEGEYTVRVTNNTATSTGCFSISTFTIQPNPTAVSIDPTGISTVNLANCNLATGAAIANGTATITAIEENGSAGILANYQFEWTNAAGTVLQNGALPTLASLATGEYAVKATNTTSQCFTQLGFTITDETIGTTAVSLTAFEDPKRCVTPQDGRLTVAASGSATTYNYEWYAGTSPTGTIIDNTNDLQGIVLASGTIDHTVKAINTLNNCWAVDTYTLALVINPVEISVSSSSPVTSCIADNGSVFGTVTNDNSLEYSYAWFTGTSPSGTASFTGKQVNNLSAGSYTMVATDLLDAFCVSPPQTTELVDQKIIPVTTASQTSMVTNCDPTKANGAAAASVAGNIVDYTFDWYAGNPATGPILLSSPEINNLSAGVYTVITTNRVTGCVGTTTVTIGENLDVVPNPAIAVLSNVTDCVSKANGALSASVDGNTSDYIFNWYRGTSVGSTVDYTGEIVEGLAIGDYTVTATSRSTGCTSGPDTDRIIEEFVYPEFRFDIVPASCDRENGMASLIMVSNVAIGGIEWTSNGSVLTAGSPLLTNIPSGEYEVTVTSQLGCSTSQSVVIGTEIHPYNGISRNGDNRNEFFLIDCIENFTGNNVKIFNRAGTLVYEIDGYNNVDIIFDGKSNKGISPFGNGLPDGTYFYVIDKRDGSKPLAGYLELVK